MIASIWACCQYMTSFKMDGFHKIHHFIKKGWTASRLVVKLDNDLLAMDARLMINSGSDREIASRRQRELQEQAFGVQWMDEWIDELLSGRRVFKLADKLILESV